MKNLLPNKNAQVLLETDIADAEMKETYDMLIKGDAEKLAISNKELIHKLFVSKIVIDYLKLALKEVNPVKLALDLNGSEIRYKEGSYIWLPDITS